MQETKPTKVRNDFSKVVDAYSKYRRDYVNKAYDLIYSFCPNRESNVLDVGCGTGFVTNHLADYYKHVTGTDKSKEMLDVARSIGPANVSFVVASTEQLPFENESFDLVTAAAAYHWFDYDKAGKEIYRVLKPNGKLCVFWKYALGNFDGYLPEFVVKNLRKFVSDIPKTNKEPISKDIFLRVGFSKIDDEEFDFDDSYSKDEILGYIQSHSTFNLLNDEQKEEYKKLNEEGVIAYLQDGKFIFKSRMEMWFIEK
jgi:ubiquinone/menaquinone biosynthesis C-methylase UbiE